MDEHTKPDRATLEISRAQAREPQLEKDRDAAFAYENEKETDPPCREARYAGRDADSEGRYGIDRQIEEVQKRYRRAQR